MTTVTALSVNPSGNKVACYGSNWPFDDDLVYPTNSYYGYIFVLDATNGAIVSSLLELKHDAGTHLVQSRAFLLRDNGDVFLALGAPVQETNPLLMP